MGGVVNVTMGLRLTSLAVYVDIWLRLTVYVRWGLTLTGLVAI